MIKKHSCVWLLQCMCCVFWTEMLYTALWHCIYLIPHCTGTLLSVTLMHCNTACLLHWCSEPNSPKTKTRRTTSATSKSFLREELLNFISWAWLLPFSRRKYHLLSYLQLLLHFYILFSRWPFRFATLFCILYTHCMLTVCPLWTACMPRPFHTFSQVSLLC